MTVGELFIKIGVKGDGSAKKALKGTQDGLGAIKSMSLEAKAAIVAVVYGLQQMMSSSMKTGTTLSNFAAMTGISTKALQQWEFAGGRFNIAASEIQSSFEGLFAAMARMKIEGADNSLGFIMQSLGRGSEEIDRFINDTQYAMETMREFNNLTTVDKGTKFVMNEKMGMSGAMQAGFAQNAFDPKILARAPTLGEGGIKALAGVNAQWSEIMSKISNSIDNLVIAFGPDITKQIGQFVTVGLDLVKEIAKLIVELKPGETIKTLYSAAKDPKGAAKELGEFLIDDIKNKSKLWKMEASDKVQEFSKKRELIQLRKAQGEYEAKYGTKKVSPVKDDGYTMFEEKVDSKTINLYIDKIVSPDPVEAGQEVAKHVTNTMNLIPTRGRAT